MHTTLMKNTQYRFQLSRLAIALGVVIPFLLPTTVLAHGKENHAEPESASEHTQTTLDPTDIESRQSFETRLATPVVSPAQGGLWSAVEEWPLVAIHAALLPNGKVLAWDATPDDSDDDPHTTDNFTTRVTLWDPITGQHVETNNDTDTDLFCAGSAHLWDGRVLFAGGDSGTARANGPLSNTNIYDPETNTWRRAPNMHAPRWYSSVAALGNGEMLTFGGAYQPTPAGEVFQFDQTWRALPITNPSPNLEDYQWLQATPDGDVLTFGPGNSVSVIETDGSGEFRPGPRRDSVDLRDYGSYAMFDVGKILVSGGANALSSSVVIDTDTQQTTDTSSLHVGRRQHDLTILADGSVLASGGHTGDERFVSATEGTKVVELWDPNSGRWDLMNPMFVERQYHSITMLLADGRVLSAGGGICGDCYAIGYEEKNAEIYTPPYLFSADGSLAPRPQITSVPEQVNYSQRMVIGSSDAQSIDRMHLIKLGSVTHSQNQEQRLVPLSFERSQGALSVTLPSSRYVAPPGHYLLYAVNTNGVPSVGEIIRVGHPRPLVGENVRHDLSPSTIESFEYQLEPGVFRITLQDAAGVRVQFGRSPAVSTSDANLAECTPTLINGAGVCDFAVPSEGVWYLSQRATQRISYSFVTELTPGPASGAPTPDVDQPSPPSEQAPEQEPNPVPPPVEVPNGDEVAGSPIATQRVKVGGAVNGLTLLGLALSIVLGRRKRLGILDSQL